MSNQGNRNMVEAQAAYLKADLTGTREDWDDYYARVQTIAWDQEISYDDAKYLIENGPCVY